MQHKEDDRRVFPLAIKASELRAFRRLLRIRRSAPRSRSSDRGLLRLHFSYRRRASDTPTCRSALIPSNSTGLKKDMYDAVAEFMRISADVDRRANEEEYKQIQYGEYHY